MILLLILLILLLQLLIPILISLQNTVSAEEEGTQPTLLLLGCHRSVYVGDLYLRSDG